MGCRSINVLRLGLRMFSMNLSLSFSCNTGELERPNNQDGIVAGLSVSMLVLSYLSDLFISDNLINLPDKTTEHNRI